jgi:hypothetical protein
VERGPRRLTGSLGPQKVHKRSRGHILGTSGVICGDEIPRNLAVSPASLGSREVSNPSVTANEKGTASLVNKGKRGRLLCPGAAGGNAAV